MTDFLRRLPAPRNADRRSDYETPIGSYPLMKTAVEHTASCPAYGFRKFWIPSKETDFGEGGAFPECHIIQFPLNMGKDSMNRSRVVALEMDSSGKLNYTALLHQNHQNDRVLHTSVKSQIATDAEPHELARPSEEDAKKRLEETRQVLDDIVEKKILSKKISPVEQKEPQFFRYTPSQQAPGHNSNCAQRVIKMVEAVVDPLEPPKFRHKKVPAGPSSPPPAVLHSPPRKLTQADQLAWKIPPCISNWKNQKGYTIPLDKRLQADGRGLLETQVNDRFASLSESLYIAERAAREEIRIRNELLKKKKAKEEEQREEELRKLAAAARDEKMNIMNQEMNSENRKVFEEKRKAEFDRKREIERMVRLERTGKKRRNRDEDRDVSERVALGQAPPSSQDVMYDARLFNQTAGLSSGFEQSDELYDIYDKPLFAEKAGGNLYRFEKDRMAQSLGSASVPSFSGADKTKERTAPVEFEKDTADPFGLDSLLVEAKKRT